MVTVQFEEWLTDEQKEALRHINKSRKVRAVYEDALRRGFNEYTALCEVYDWLFYEGAAHGITDLRV